MARWLKQSTSVDVPIGPFLDSTDGVTAETALTITQPDIRLKKNGGAWAQKAAAQTLTHEENGYYEVTLDATDTNTLGLLRLAVAESGALPVWEDFLVVPGYIYDWFIADVATINVNTSSFTNGAITSAAFAAGAINAAAIAADAITDAKVASDVTIASVTGSVGSVAGAVGSVTGNVGGNVAGSVASVTGAVGSVTGNVGGNVVGSVASVTGNVGGSVASVTGAVGSVTGSVGSVTGAVGSVTAGVTVTTNNDKTGYRLSATGVDDVLDEVVEGTVTLRQSQRVQNAAAAGEISGAATTTVVVRDISDTKTRITATVDSDGNRTAVTVDAT